MPGGAFAVKDMITACSDLDERGRLCHTSPLQSARYLQRDVMMHPHEVNALLERVRQVS